MRSTAVCWGVMATVAAPSLGVVLVLFLSALSLSRYMRALHAERDDTVDITGRLSSPAMLFSLLTEEDAILSCRDGDDVVDVDDEDVEEDEEDVEDEDEVERRDDGDEWVRDDDGDEWVRDGGDA